MASVDLIFRAPPSGALPVHLVFGGDDDAPSVPDVTLHGSLRLSGLRMRVGVRVAVRLHGGLAMSGLRLRMRATYDINVSRPMVGQLRSRWQDASGAHSGVQGRYQQAAPLSTGAAVRWQDGTGVAHAVCAHWQACVQLAGQVASAYQQAEALPVRPLEQRYQEAMRLRAGGRDAYQEAQRLCVVPVRARFEDARRVRHGVGGRFQDAAPLGVLSRTRMGVAVPVFVGWGAQYQEAWPPRPGRWAGPPVPPGREPCYVPTLPAHLVFERPADSSLPTNLVFICERHGPGPEPGATVVVPIRIEYMIVNSLSLRRLDGNVSIPTYSFGMSLDVDSWTWSWQATLHADALPLIQPDSGGDPVYVVAKVNGVDYHLVAESFSRQREFGSSRVSVKGRGRAAVLDAPYAPVLNHSNAVARTAQQLMGDVLTLNGVGIGWGVNWGITDWLVPEGVWAHQGTYVSALLDIAEAAGGYLQPHRTDPVLSVLARYPAPPWEWSGMTPDYELPSAVVAVEGIEWTRLPAYKRVFVEGVKPGAGVRGDVNRTGVAGGMLAPMVVHPLITHADAARQRGIAELSNTGRQAHISLRLPVLAETGVIQPGALVRYLDGGLTHLGIVRATQVEWRDPALRQMLTVETHPE